MPLSHYLCRIYNRLHPSYLFYALLVGITSGIVLGYSGIMTLGLPAYTIIIALVVLLLCFIKTNCVTIAISIIAGVIIGNIRVGITTNSIEYFNHIVNQEITVSGTIIEDPNTDKSPTVVKVGNLQVINEDAEYPVSGTIYAQIASKVDFARSDMITLRGKVGAGFGTYVAKMFRPEVVQVSRAETGDIFLKVRNHFADLVRKVIPSPEVDLGLGYLMGMKTGIPDDLLDTLQLVGMTHVIVASGAHLGILVNLSKKVFGKISRFSGVLFSILLILGFTMIVGFTPSMSRASLVSIFSLVATYVGRKFSPLRLILLVATLALLYNPSNIISLGWQLSFSSFFGILVLAPRITKFLYGGKKPKFIPEMLLTSLATSLICAPIMLYNFGSLSLLSFAANLVILPTLPYAMGFAFLAGITQISTFLAQSVGLIAKFILDIHIWVVNFLKDHTTFILTMDPGQAWVFWLYLLPAMLLVGIYGLEYSSKKRKLCYNQSYEYPFRNRNARAGKQSGQKTPITVRD